MMRKWLISFLVTRGGALLSYGISLGVAYLVAKLALYLPEIAEKINQGELVCFIWALLMAGINAATNRWLTKDAKIIQEALNDAGATCKVDGWIGKETVGAFRDKTGLAIRVRRATPAGLQAGRKNQG